MVSRWGLLPSPATTEHTQSLLSLSSVHLSVAEGQLSQWPGVYSGPSEKPDPPTCPWKGSLWTAYRQTKHLSRPSGQLEDMVHMKKAPSSGPLGCSCSCPAPPFRSFYPQPSPCQDLCFLLALAAHGISWMCFLCSRSSLS